MRRALKQAWELDDADKAERPMRNLARRFEQEAPGELVGRDRRIVEEAEAVRAVGMGMMPRRTAEGIDQGFLAGQPLGCIDYRLG